MKKYDYNRYTLRLTDELSEFIVREAAKHGLTPQNYLRLLIAEAERRANEAEAV